MYMYLCHTPIGPVANNSSSKKRNSTTSTTMNGHLKDPSTIPSKSERLNSPNTNKWEPDVRMMMSTNQWLKVWLFTPGF